jgi:hypothetical protein
MTDPTTSLLRDVDAYLSAQHARGWHDQMAANLGCAGCELRDRIAALSEQTAADPTISQSDQTALRDRIAEALADATGAEWPAQAFLTEADAVLAVLPASVSRAAVLREAADEAASAARLFPDDDECATAIGALEGLADRLRRMADETQPETGAAEHACKPGAKYFYCPTSARVESDCHGGFDVCCDRPDLHMPPAGPQQDGAAS